MARILISNSPGNVLKFSEGLFLTAPPERCFWNLPFERVKTTKVSQPCFSIKLSKTCMNSTSIRRELWNENKRFLANEYMLNISDKNARKRSEICSKLTLKTPVWPQWHFSGVFFFNLEHISHLLLGFLLFTLNR